MVSLILPGRACCRPSCSSLRAVARDRLILSPSSGQRSSPRFFHSTPARASDSQDPSSSSRISYRVAVSSSGKGRRFHPFRNAHTFDPSLHDALGLVTKESNPLIRRRARPDSGADAFFVSKVGHDLKSGDHDNGAVAFAVADGVGGWEESRVDPADFSHGLCGYMAGSALSWSSPAEKLRPKNLMQMGYDQVVADEWIRAGASTASVGVGWDDGRVELANLGDSGSVLFRSAAVQHYSTAQTHGFNTPYQLSIIPPRMRAQASIFGGAYLEDFPRDAAVTSLRMQHGDVLMLATDGVFDNLNNQDILKLVTRQMTLTGAWTGAPPTYAIGPSDQLPKLSKPGGLTDLLSSQPSSSPKNTKNDDADRYKLFTLSSLLATTITGNAKLASLDLRRDSPFAKQYQRYYPFDHYRGGKVDDICVLVVVAVDEGRVQQGQGQGSES